MYILYNLKLFYFFVLFSSILIFSKFSKANNSIDCTNPVYYIKNIKSQAIDKNLNEAKLKAEEIGRSKAFSKLLGRLVLRTNIKKKYKIELKKIISFMKINQEANSMNSFEGSFDFCFNRDEVLKFFKENNFKFAEVYSLPISIFPIYAAPQGFVFYDENDLWYNLWKNYLSKKDSLLQFKLSTGNLYTKRSISGREVIKSDKETILKILQNDKTKRLLIVILEPKLTRNGKYILKTTGKLYDEFGNFDQTIYYKTKTFKTFKQAITLDESNLLNDIKNMIFVFEESWKKNNFFKDNILTKIDIFIPIKNNSDWFNYLTLLNQLPYINKVRIAGLKSDVGKVNILFQGTKNTFITILNEKGLKLKQVNQEFILIKRK